MPEEENFTAQAFSNWRFYYLWNKTGEQLRVLLFASELLMSRGNETFLIVIFCSSFILDLTSDLKKWNYLRAQSGGEKEFGQD